MWSWTNQLVHQYVVDLLIYDDHANWRDCLDLSFLRWIASHGAESYVFPEYFYIVILSAEKLAEP